jgi:hypothetical protein
LIGKANKLLLPKTTKIIVDEFHLTNDLHREHAPITSNDYYPPTQIVIKNHGACVVEIHFHNHLEIFSRSLNIHPPTQITITHQFELLSSKNREGCCESNTFC